MSVCTANENERNGQDNATLTLRLFNTMASSMILSPPSQQRLQQSLVVTKINDDPLLTGLSLRFFDTFSQTASSTILLSS